MAEKEKKSAESVHFILEKANLPKELLTLPVPLSFFDLPRELQIRIFSFLTQKELCKTVSPVCRYWWILSKDGSFWKTLDISMRREDEIESLTLLLKRGSTMLKKLKINTGIERFSLKEFAVASSACPMLKRLDLSGCQEVKSEILHLFAENCPLIEELNVSRDVSRFCVDYIGLESVSHIVKLKHLRVLQIGFCTLVDDDCIKLIAEKCSHLQELDINNTLCTNEGIVYVEEHFKTTLRRLVVGGGKLADSAFQRINLCVNLQELVIYRGQHLTDITFDYLKMLTGLKKLTMVLIISMTATGVKSFFSGPHVGTLVELEMYNFTRIDDEGVYNITQNCRLLKKLVLFACPKVTEKGLEHIVKHCRTLSYLDLRRSSVTGLCLKSVPENLSCLQYLDVTFCRIDKSIMVDIAKRMPQLRCSF